jgi:hypothetical protein
MSKSHRMLLHFVSKIFIHTAAHLRCRGGRCCRSFCPTPEIPSKAACARVHHSLQARIEANADVLIEWFRGTL